MTTLKTPPRSRLSPARGWTKCPACTRKLTEGEQVYSCRVCKKDCCTACSDTTAKHDVVCDGCLEAGYDDGWTQGNGISSNAEVRDAAPRTASESKQTGNGAAFPAPKG